MERICEESWMVILFGGAAMNPESGDGLEKFILPCIVEGFAKAIDLTFISSQRCPGSVNPCLYRKFLFLQARSYALFLSETIYFERSQQ